MLDQVVWMGGVGLEEHFCLTNSECSLSRFILILAMATEASRKEQVSRDNDAKHVVVCLVVVVLSILVSAYSAINLLKMAIHVRAWCCAFVCSSRDASCWFPHGYGGGGGGGFPCFVVVVVVTVFAFKPDLRAVCVRQEV